MINFNLGVGASFGNAPPPPTLSDYGTDIRVWMRQAGDQKLILPGTVASPRIYTAGAVTDAAHTYNAGGSHKGNLILEAEEPGGVIVDLSYPGKSLAGGLTANGNLVISGTSSRVTFSNVYFRDGTVTVSGTNSIQFWHTDHQFDIDVWHAEPNQGYPTPYGNYHAAPRALTYTNNTAQLRLFGSYLHNTGTAMYSGSFDTIDRLTIMGVEIGDLGFGLTGPDFSVIHPDCIALFGKHLDTLISDCYFHADGPGTLGIVQFDETNSLLNVMDITNTWITNCDSVGLSLDLEPSGKISGVFTDVHVWGNGPAPSTDVGYQVVQDVRTQPIVYSITSFPYSQISYTQSGSNVNVAQVGDDPATQWRDAAGQGPEDCEAYMAANGWPASS